MSYVVHNAPGVGQWQQWNRSGTRVAGLIGFDVAKGDWASANATLGPGDTHRLFYPTILPAAFDPDSTPGDVTCIVSYKQADTNVAAYVNSIPSSRSAVMVYHHEPEGDFTSGAKFAAEFKTQSGLIRAQGRANVRVAMIAGNYRYRDASTDADTKAGNYLRGLGPYVDFFGVDQYQNAPGTSAGADWPPTGLATYDRWLNWLSLVNDPAIVGEVRPLGIVEYGIDSAAGAAEQRQRIAQDRDYLKTAFDPGNANAVSAWPLQTWCYWWHSGKPYYFTDPETVALWQSIENGT